MAASAPLQDGRAAALRRRIEMNLLERRKHHAAPAAEAAGAGWRGRCGRRAVGFELTPHG
jgi:hypothetical protein